MPASVYVQRAKMAFNYADNERKGSLTKHQYRIAMTAVFGYCPDKVEVKHIFRTSADKISYEEFEYWVTKKCDPHNMQSSAGTLFSLLDSDCTYLSRENKDPHLDHFLKTDQIIDKGYLGLNDFCTASKSVDLRISVMVWKKVFEELDRCKKGYIDFNEFLDVVGNLNKYQ